MSWCIFGVRVECVCVCVCECVCMGEFLSVPVSVFVCLVWSVFLCVAV